MARFWVKGKSPSNTKFRVCKLGKMSLCNNLNYLPHFKLFGIVVKNVMKPMKLTSIENT